ncbi:MAG TPA: hypothetical protein PK384_13250, partial [Candidatus Latescibacteria bacterium]|nr:hypothetical protein [Candidatus Latescibacterota bacterium]
PAVDHTAGRAFSDAGDRTPHTARQSPEHLEWGGSQSRVRIGGMPGRNAARSRADCIDKLCGEDAVKTLITNRLRVVNLIDNL